VESVIRAYDVIPLSRGAQFIASLRPHEHELTCVLGNDEPSMLGLTDTPSRAPGGIVVRGEIRREALVNLTALRTLHASGPEATLKLRRYILGLVLVSLHAAATPAANNLRQGCLLVRDAEQTPEWGAVTSDGDRSPFNLTRRAVFEYAQATAEAFGVGRDHRGSFEPDRVKAEVAKAQEKRVAKKTAKALRGWADE
jgi:hypothetical protein